MKIQFKPRQKKILTLSALFFLCITSFQAMTIKLATVAPDGSQWHKALMEMGQEWRELSDGKITLQIYAGGVAGDDQDLIRKMRIGQLQAAAIATSGLAYLDSDITALTFPNNIQNDDELKFVLSKLGPFYEESIQKKGFRILCWSNAGWVHFFSKEKVFTPDDMRKQKLFFWGKDPTYFELLKKSGYNPISLSITDLLSGLQTGLITAFASPPIAALGYQWYLQAPNMCSLRWQPLPGVVIISERAWKNVPDKLKPQLQKSAVMAGTKIWNDNIKIEAEAIEAMEKNSLIVNNLSQEDIALWEKGIREIGIPLFVGNRFSAEVFNKVNEALEEYRKTDPSDK